MRVRGCVVGLLLVSASVNGADQQSAAITSALPKAILQRYADVWRGSDGVPLGRDTILLFDIKGQGGGEFFVTLSDTPGGSIVAGRPTYYDVRFEVDIDVLKRLDRGELNALTAMGQAESRDAAAMTATMSADFSARPSAEGMFRRLCFYFWTREWPKTVPFGDGLTREVHGGNAVVLYYDERFRSAWYQVKPGMHINADPRSQKAPFTQLIVAIRGRLSGKIDGHVVVLTEGHSLVVPPWTAAEFWAESDQYAEAVWMAIGDETAPPPPTTTATDRSDRPGGEDCRIFFTTVREDKVPKIFSMKSDGTDVRRVLPTPASEPTLSADGTQLAFVRMTSASSDSGQIFVMNLRTGATKQLTTGNRSNVQPTWSPDGTKIAFSSYRESAGATSHQEIMVMDADGSNQQTITNTPAWTQNFLPRWSPDGTRLAFARGIAGGQPQVFVMEADGSGAKNLSNDRASEVPSDWSPDGTRILFRAPTDRSSTSDTAYQIFEMQADGSAARRLTNDRFLNSQPRYSPDGTRIAFTSMATGHVQLFVMNADGTNRRNLTNSPSNDNQAAWSCTKK